MKKILLAGLFLFSACNSDISKVKLEVEPTPTSNTTFYYNDRLIKSDSIRTTTTQQPTPISTISNTPIINYKLVPKTIYGYTSGKWRISENSLNDKYLYICQEGSKLSILESYEYLIDNVPDNLNIRIGTYENHDMYISESTVSNDTYFFPDMKDSYINTGVAAYKNSQNFRSVEGQRISKTVKIQDSNNNVIKICSSEGVFDNSVRLNSASQSPSPTIYYPSPIPTITSTPYTIITTPIPTSTALYIPTPSVTSTPNLPECPSTEKIIESETYSTTPQAIPGVNCSVSKPINIPSGQCWVDSYYRTDGTYVSGYYRQCPTSTPTVSYGSSGRCWVNGYYRKNGTYVSGYYRSCG